MDCIWLDLHWPVIFHCKWSWLSGTPYGEVSLCTALWRISIWHGRLVNWARVLHSYCGNQCFLPKWILNSTTYHIDPSIWIHWLVYNCPWYTNYMAHRGQRWSIHQIAVRATYMPAKAKYSHRPDFYLVCDSELRPICWMLAANQICGIILLSCVAFCVAMDSI